MSPARFHIQGCRVLEIESEMFKRVLQLAFIKYEFGTTNLFKAGSIMSLLYFAVCKLLETWLYICLCAREFLCKCACLGLLWLFAHLFVDNVWKWLNLRTTKWHPVNTESQLCANMWQKYTDMYAYKDNSLYTLIIRGQYGLFCTQLFSSASSTWEILYSSDPLLQLFSQITDSAAISYPNRCSSHLLGFLFCPL